MFKQRKEPLDDKTFRFVSSRMEGTVYASALPISTCPGGCLHQPCSQCWSKQTTYCRNISASARTARSSQITSSLQLEELLSLAFKCYSCSSLLVCCLLLLVYKSSHFPSILFRTTKGRVMSVMKLWYRISVLEWWSVWSVFNNVWGGKKRGLVLPLKCVLVREEEGWLRGRMEGWWGCQRKPAICKSPTRAPVIRAFPPQHTQRYTLILTRANIQ